MSEPRDTDELAQLAAKIDQAKHSEEREEPPVSGSQMSMAWRISIELVAGVAVGGVLGYFIDQGLNSSPIALLLGIALGAVAGFRNMARSVKESP